MSIENFRRQLEAKELQPYGKHSPFREMLEQLIDTLVRLDREAWLGESCGHRARENGVQGNSYKRNGVPNASGSWKLPVTKISYSLETRRFPNAMNSCQRGS